jgi:hypothetical protein
MTSPTVDQLTAFTIDDPVLGAIHAGQLPELEVILAAIKVRGEAVLRLAEELYELKVARGRALRRYRLP